MKHGSLFSGIGGFDLAAQWMGWENVFHCEWNPFGQRILKYYWPKAISYEDITQTDFSIWRGKIDILSGGFPCQPYSNAGKRLGKEDDRHLWPEMLRVIREVKPQFVVGENVSGLLSWNGGLVFEEVQTDLENEGYRVQSCVLPACSVNAPHRRDRVWIIANRDDGNGKKVRLQTRGEVNVYGANGSRTFTDAESKRTGRLRDESKEEGTCAGDELFRKQYRVQSDEEIASDTSSFRQWRESDRVGEAGFFNQKSAKDDWRDFPVEAPVCFGNDGISERLDFNSVFEKVPFPKKPITYAKWRKESIKGAGNAIVPQVAYQIFKAIEKTINQ